MDHQLSADDIEQSDDAYGMVADYFHELRIRGEKPLPANGNDLLLFFDVDSEYHNGGLWQYFANRTSDGGVLDDDVRRLPIFLELIGANEMRTVMLQATDCWLEGVAQHREDEATGLDDATQRFFERGELMEEFDEVFSASYEATAAIVSKYVRRHADDYCRAG